MQLLLALVATFFVVVQTHLYSVYSPPSAAQAVRGTLERLEKNGLLSTSDCRIGSSAVLQDASIAARSALFAARECKARIRRAKELDDSADVNYRELLEDLDDIQRALVRATTYRNINSGVQREAARKWHAWLLTNGASVRP